MTVLIVLGNRLNDDGSFKYIPDSSCLDKEVEFSYYIETTINNDVVKSNNSIIKIKVDKDSSVIDNAIIENIGEEDLVFIAVVINE